MFLAIMFAAAHILRLLLVDGVQCSRCGRLQVAMWASRGDVAKPVTGGAVGAKAVLHNEVAGGTRSPPITFAHFGSAKAALTLSL